MCGRYVLADPEDIHERFETENALEFAPSFNVAPGQNLPVVTHNSPNRVELMKWGLIPFWAKDSKIGYRMINARAEGIEKKPSFRKAFKDQRCLIPATGFYEWQRREKGRLPYYFYLKNEEMFAFAGLYDIWKDQEGVEIKSYTIITTQANSLIGTLHDRMPVVLRHPDEEKWLSHDSLKEQLLALLKPFPSQRMGGYLVSTEVNNTKINTSDLIKPEPFATGLF